MTSGSKPDWRATARNHSPRRVWAERSHRRTGIVPIERRHQPPQEVWRRQNGHGQLHIGVGTRSDRRGRFWLPPRDWDGSWPSEGLPHTWVCPGRQRLRVESHRRYLLARLNIQHEKLSLLCCGSITDAINLICMLEIYKICKCFVQVGLLTRCKRSIDSISHGLGSYNRYHEPEV